MSGARADTPTPIPATPVAAASVTASPTASPAVAVPEASPPAPVAAPIQAEVAPAPATQVTETPAVETKTGTPAAEPEAAKPSEPAPSLLDGPPKEEAAPVETKAAEPKPGDQPALPTYEPLKLPEGVKLDDTELKGFDELVGGLELSTKADHAAVQEFRQKAADFYVAQVQKAVKAHDDNGAQVWSQMRDDWRQEFKTDKQIGGNRQNTTLAGAAAMIEQFGGSKTQIAELRRVLRVTGAGDNINLVRLLHNVSKVLSEGQPVPANNPKAPQIASKKTRRYSNSNGANGAI